MQLTAATTKRGPADSYRRRRRRAAFPLKLIPAGDQWRRGALRKRLRSADVMRNSDVRPARWIVRGTSTPASPNAQTRRKKLASVPGLMDQFIVTVHENWYMWSETVLAAYALWRLNWIHLFVEGNGRTARAACYYLLCVKSGA